VHFTIDGGNVFATRIWTIVARLGRQQMSELAKHQPAVGHVERADPHT
jgi:hypothetical protein